MNDILDTLPSLEEQATIDERAALMRCASALTRMSKLNISWAAYGAVMMDDDLRYALLTEAERLAVGEAAQAIANAINRRLESQTSPRNSAYTKLFRACTSI